MEELRQIRYLTVDTQARWSFVTLPEGSEIVDLVERDDELMMVAITRERHPKALIEPIFRPYGYSVRLDAEADPDGYLTDSQNPGTYLGSALCPVIGRWVSVFLTP